MAALTAMGIVAGLGSAGASAYGASQQGKGGAPNMQAIPAPAYATALQRYIARTLAANATKQAPSVLDFARSGGKAGFELDATAFTPGEAQNLGFTDQNGGAIPYFDPQRQSMLTPEQSLFIGQNRMQQRARGAIKGMEGLQERYARLLATDQKLRSQLDAGGLKPKQAERLRGQMVDNAGRLYTTQGQLFGNEPYLPQRRAAGGEQTDWGQVFYDRLPGQRYSLGMGGGGWGQIK